MYNRQSTYLADKGTRILWEFPGFYSKKIKLNAVGSEFFNSLENTWPSLIFKNLSEDEPGVI